jgi:mRNA interferase RelE/StbE
VNYKINLTSFAHRQLDRLHGDSYNRIESAINSLSKNPQPTGCRKLEGVAEQWRIRVGEYRILYTIDDAKSEISILKIGHRRDVYR